MKPHRIRMTHNLLLNYGLYRKMEIYRPHKATQEEMTKFHSDDYIRFLRSIRPDNMSEYNKQMQRFNVGEVSQSQVIYVVSYILCIVFLSFHQGLTQPRFLSL